MKFLIPLLLICSLAWGIERQNITVDEKWVPKDSNYFMCNIRCETPKTLLKNVKGVTFERCNLYGCEVDESNILIQSNVVDTTPPPVYTEEELKLKKQQLESDLATNNKKIPKDMLEEWVNTLERIKNEEADINP